MSSLTAIAFVLLLSASSISHLLVRVHDDFLKPYFLSIQWSDQRMEEERTYGFIACHSPLTTKEATELDLMPNNDDNDAYDTILYHGAGILKGLLSRHHLQTLDPTISSPTSLTSPSQPTAPFLLTRSQGIAFLKPIVNNKFMTTLLERLLGPNPALAQLYSQNINDTQIYRETWFEASSPMYAHSFVTMYSIIIPIRTTTIHLGPGTHRCHNYYVQGIQLILSPGDAIILHSTLLRQIQGTVIVLSFVSSPHKTKDYHQPMLPIGPSFLLSWNLHGLTLPDFHTNHINNLLSPFIGRGWTWMQTKAFLAANAPDHSALITYLHQLLSPFITPSIDTFIEGKAYAPTFQYLRACFAVVRNLLCKLTFTTLFILIFHALFSFTKIRRLTKDILLALFVVLGLTLSVYYCISASSWANAGPTIARPFLDQDVHFTEDYIEVLSTIKQNDILLSDRMKGSHHSKSGTQLNNYHTGNRNWHKATDDLAWYYLLYQGMAPIFRHSLILESLVGQRILESNDFGDFEELRPNEAYQFALERFEEMWRWPHDYRKHSGSVALEHPCRGYTRLALCKFRPAVYGHFYRESQNILPPTQSTEKTLSSIDAFALLPPSKKCLASNPAIYTYEEYDPWSLDFKLDEVVEVNFHKPLYPWSRGGFLLARSWLDCIIVGISSDLSLVEVKNINNVTKVVHSSIVRKPTLLPPSPFLPLQKHATTSSRVLACAFK